VPLVPGTARTCQAPSGALVAAPRAAADHPDHKSLEQNWDALQAARLGDGRPLSLIALPTPEPRTHRIPADRFNPTGERVVLPTEKLKAWRSVADGQG